MISILRFIFILVKFICCLFEPLIIILGFFLLSFVCFRKWHEILVEDDKIIILRNEFTKAIMFFQKSKQLWRWSIICEFLWSFVLIFQESFKYIFTDSWPLIIFMNINIEHASWSEFFHFSKIIMIEKFFLSSSKKSDSLVSFDF